MAASYPSAVKSYTTKSDGVDPNAAADINALQDEVTAVEQGILNGFAHPLLPDVTNTRALGSDAKRWATGHFQAVMIAGAPVLPPAEFTTTATGNVDDLDFGNATLIRVNNATLTTIRGLKAGSAGQRVTIVAIGAGPVNLAHQSTSDATAANRLINMVTSIATPLAAGVGSATYQYDATTARWRLVVHEQGAPISVAYTPGDYTADTGTWTVQSGDLTTYTYFVVGRTITYSIQIETSSVSATPGRLFVLAAPAGVIFPLSANVPAAANDNGTLKSGLLQLNLAVSSTLLGFLCFTGAGATGWSVSTNLTSATGALTLAVT